MWFKYLSRGRSMKGRISCTDVDKKTLQFAFCNMPFFIFFAKYLTMRKIYKQKFDKIIVQDVIGFVNMTQRENAETLKKIFIALFPLASGP